MRKSLLLLLVFSLLSLKSFGLDKPIIIDHACTDLSQVPDTWVLTAKSSFRIAYGHTSHGSQIVSGMNILESLPNSIYTYNDGESSLYLNDASLLAGDLGNPDRQTWATRTRNMLTNNTKNINLVMWSWCGQVDGSSTDIETYLSLMTQLEQEFPDITFVYMTGHLNGTGEEGNVNQRNEQIRSYCRENNKILFDFADIESYDPDGNYFLDKYADDGCNYDGGNWADEWCAANPGECEDCSCAHSKCINCQQKGKAFWWMMARIAGWEGITSVEENIEHRLSIAPNPATEYVEIEGYRNYTNHRVNPTAAESDLIRIYDNFGEEVINYETSIVNYDSAVRIDVSHFPTGLYFIQIGNYREKFVVVR